MNQSRCPHCGVKLVNFRYADACPHCHEELIENTKALVECAKPTPPTPPSWLARSLLRLRRLVES